MSSAPARGAAQPAPLGRWKLWWLAARPKTLPAALAPVIVGSATAAQASVWRWGPALAAALGAVMIQIGTNLANDVQDFERGADTGDRLGPLRITQAGLMKPAEVRRGMVVAFGIAILAGLYLTAIAGWPVVAIGLISIASGLAYTGGPLPLGYHGLGDLFVFLFFGFVAVCGTAFVIAGFVPAVAWVASVPIGALATTILAVNNVRDHETDRRAGKRTLPVLLGRRSGVLEIALLLAAAYLTPLLLFAAGASAWLLLPGATLPFAAQLLRTVSTHADGPTLNRALAGAARLLFAYSLLLALGLWLSPAVNPGSR